MQKIILPLPPIALCNTPKATAESGGRKQKKLITFAYIGVETQGLGLGVVQRQVLLVIHCTNAAS